MSNFNRRCSRVQSGFNSAIPSLSCRYIKLIDPELSPGRTKIAGHAQDEIGIRPRVAEERLPRCRCHVAHSWRLTIALIQIGAKGEVHPFETG